jgi:uncharacterized damage-inducible protein DinB
MNPESERIRSYLVAQAAKLTPAELVEKVRTDAEQLQAALASVPAEYFSKRPAAAEWSANEVAAHIVDASAAFGRAIEMMMRGEIPSSPADRVESQVPERSAEDWWSQHVANREQLFANVLATHPDANLGPTVYHPMFGDLNWREALLFLRIHDLDHARQLEEIAKAFR